MKKLIMRFKNYMKWLELEFDSVMRDGINLKQHIIEKMPGIFAQIGKIWWGMLYSVPHGPKISGGTSLSASVVVVSGRSLGKTSDSWSWREVADSSLTWVRARSNTGQVIYTHMPLSPSSITWYRLNGWGSKQAHHAMH